MQPYQAFISVLAGLLAVPTLAIANSGSAAVNPTGLDTILKPLIRYQTFRLKAEELDRIFRKACRKTVDVSEVGRVYHEYECQASSGIRSIKFDQWTYHECGNVLMRLSIAFDVAYYTPVEALARHRLGRPNHWPPTYLSWRYTSDPLLSKCGGAIVSLEANEDGTADLEFGLEQGP